MTFFIAILIVYMDGQLAHFETLPVPSYSDCQKLVAAVEERAKTQLPGADVRTSCVASESIGQNGA